MPISGRGLTQLADNCFIHTALVGGQPSARHLVGVIYRQDTANRDNPPECLNGFSCAGTPLAKGHVMALELGGPDIPENIVPQYGVWQGSPIGAWRAMELGVVGARVDADVFIVDIEYPAGPFVETYQQQYARFSDGDKLHFWQDERIPSHFRVWTVANNWTIGAIRIQDYLNGNDVYKDGAIGGLIAAMPDTRKVFDEQINAMPQVDRNYWRGQMVRAFVNEQYDRNERREQIYNQRIERLNEQEKKRYRDAVAAITGQRPRIPLKERFAKIMAIKKPIERAARPTLGKAQWLADDNVAQKLSNDLVASADATRGWTPVETATFTPQYLRDRVFDV